MRQTHAAGERVRRFMPRGIPRHRFTAHRRNPPWRDPSSGGARAFEAIGGVPELVRAGQRQDRIVKASFNDPPGRWESTNMGGAYGTAIPEEGFILCRSCPVSGTASQQDLSCAERLAAPGCEAEHVPKAADQKSCHCSIS